MDLLILSLQTRPVASFSRHQLHREPSEHARACMTMHKMPLFAWGGPRTARLAAPVAACPGRRADHAADRPAISGRNSLQPGQVAAIGHVSSTCSGSSVTRKSTS